MNSIRPFCALALLLTLVFLGSPARATEPDQDLSPHGVWPLRPVPQVANDFAPPATTWGPGHRGVDLLGTAGQSVRTALPGRVSYAGRLAGRGVVVVDHGDTRTTYEPVRANRTVGERVGVGEVVGVLELFGSHCFPRACLHWGWLRGSSYLDPLRLVEVGPVRLLPLWRAQPVESAYPDWSPLGRSWVRRAGAPAGRPAAGGPW